VELTVLETSMEEQKRQRRPKQNPCRTLTFSKSLSTTPAAKNELETLEQLLAQFVARAFVGDHPGLFVPIRGANADSHSTGSDRDEE